MAAIELRFQQSVYFPNEKDALFEKYLPEAPRILQCCLKS